MSTPVSTVLKCGAPKGTILELFSANSRQACHRSNSLPDEASSRFWGTKGAAIAIRLLALEKYRGRNVKAVAELFHLLPVELSFLLQD
jgi:hypothetical protein